MIGGNQLYRGKDIGFVGNETEYQSLTPTILNQDIWKRVAKQVVTNLVLLEIHARVTYFSHPIPNRVITPQSSIATSLADRVCKVLL